MSTFLCKNGVRKEYFLTPTFIIEPFFIGTWKRLPPLFDCQRKFYFQQENASLQTNALFEGMRFLISWTFACTIHVFASFAFRLHDFSFRFLEEGLNGFHDLFIGFHPVHLIEVAPSEPFGIFMFQ